MYFTVSLEFLPISIFLTLQEKQKTIFVWNKMLNFSDFALDLICMVVEMLPSDYLKYDFFFKLKEIMTFFFT